MRDPRQMVVVHFKETRTHELVGMYITGTTISCELLCTVSFSYQIAGRS
jgi:hypothetical protein